MVAIRKVLKGEFYSSEEPAYQGWAQVRPLALDRLTDLERKIFELIGSGRTTRLIAAELNIDVTRVQSYRTRIKEKLCLETDVALLRQAIHWHFNTCQTVNVGTPSKA